MHQVTIIVAFFSMVPWLPLNLNPFNMVNKQ